MSCIFCSIAEGSIPADIVARGQTGLAFLDLHPKQPGHTLVIPREHVRDLGDGAAAFARIAPLVTGTAARLKAKLGAGGIKLVVNSGADAGQEVFHLHVHLVPFYGESEKPADREAVVGLLCGDA